MTEGQEFLPQPSQREALTQTPVNRRKILQVLGTTAALSLLGSSSPEPTHPQSIQTFTTPSIDNLAQIETGETQTETNEFFVVMPGFGGSGEDLTYLRRLMDAKFGSHNNYVTSSIVEKHAHAREDLQGGYYRQVALEIAKKAGDKKITIVGHSLGGLEMLSLSKELIKTDWQGKGLELAFYVTPGLGAKEPGSLINMVSRVGEMSKRFGEFDQHMLYPLPESFYQKKTLEVPKGYEIVEYTPEYRLSRREWFFNLAINHPEVFPNRNPQSLLKELDIISNGILSQPSSQEFNDLLRQRGDLLRPILDAVAAGEHIDNDTHVGVLRQYKELQKYLASGSPRALLSTSANLLGALGGIAVSLSHGVDRDIADIVRSAEERGVNVAVDIVRAENDLALSSEDAEIFQGRLSNRGLQDIIKTMVFMQYEGHTTFGYTPVVTEKVFPSLNKIA